jgi:spermidine/putrescine transport system permease protein
MGKKVRHDSWWRRFFRVKLFVTLIALGTIAFLWLPILILTITSFSTGRVTEWPPPGYTFKWYTALLGNTQALHAIQTSIIIAGVTALCATALGTCIAYGLTQFDIKRKQLISNLIYLPMIISPLVIGISLILFYHAIGLPLGYVSVIVGHIIRAIPFASLIMVTSFLGVRRSLVEAALDLGATPLSTFRRVIVPRIMPAVVAGLLISFTISFDDISTTYFTIGGGKVTVQTYIMEQIQFVITPEVNALTAFILAVSFVLVTAISILQRRQEE